MHPLDAETDNALVQQLRYNFKQKDKLPDSVYRNSLEICFKYQKRRPCDEATCNRIHVCRSFKKGTSSRTACENEYDLHSIHNSTVLHRHRATELTDHQIVEILRGKEHYWPTKGSKGSASASSTPNRADKRQNSGASAGRPGRAAHAAALAAAHAVAHAVA